MSSETEVIKKFIEDRYKRLENGERRPSYEYISVQEIKEMISSSDCEDSVEGLKPIFLERNGFGSEKEKIQDKNSVLDLPKLE